MTNSLWLTDLAAYCLQVALLVIAGAALPLLFRLRLPRARLVYWQVLLILCLTLPLVEPWKQAADSPAGVSITTIPLSTSEGAPHWRLPPAPVLVLGILAAGAGVRLLWLALGLYRLRRYRRASRPFEDESVRELQIRLGVFPLVCLSSDVTGPVTFGSRSPVILFPDRFPSLAPAVRSAIACHELLHVRRRDWLFTVFEELTRAALWFHPAIWWLLGQIQLSREQAVDAEAVGLLNDPGRYVEALLAIASSRLQPDLAPAPLFLRRRHLSQRVASILKEVSMSKRQLLFSLASISGTLCLTLWLAVLLFPLRAPAQEQPSGTISMNTGGLHLLHSIAPRYPKAARERHIEGDVVLELTVNEKGMVADARVVSGPEELRNAALESVLRWHFSEDSALPAKSQVTISFRLPASSPKSPQPEPEDAADLGVVQAVQLDGLQAQDRNSLLARLPVHEGGRLTADSLRRLKQVVAEFDEHLTVHVSPPRADHTVAILVSLGSEPSLPPQRIRVGGKVQSENLIKKVTPPYPPLAKQAKVQGNVRLSVLIAKDGTVQTVDLVEGHPLLAPAAIEAVKSWVYRPTLLNGDPVEVLSQVDVSFTLLE